LLRVLLLLSFLLLNLYACKGGYDSCKHKIIDSSSIVGKNIEIPISQTKRLIFTQNPKTLRNTKIIKKDPFLSLYLVKSKKYFRYPFRFNINYSLGVASVNKTKAVEGIVTKKQIGLNNFAKFNNKTSYPALLLTSCCSLEGVITPKGIIEKSYLRHFLYSKNKNYGDIGIRVIKKGRKVIVSQSDPFMLENRFKKGDTILEFDGKKVVATSSFMKKILFSKVGQKYRVRIKRDSKILNLNIVVVKRYGGGFLSDTFLEQKGIYFDKNLFVTKVETKAKHYGLKVGDHLLSANEIQVKNQMMLRKYIENFEDSALLLFERNGFQFFVKIFKKPIKPNH